MDLLCFFLSCVCYAFVSVWLFVPCGHLLGKGLPLGSRLWCSTIGNLGQVWYLIVSIPDLCTLTYLDNHTRCRLDKLWLHPFKIYNLVIRCIFFPFLFCVCFIIYSSLASYLHGPISFASKHSSLLLVHMNFCVTLRECARIQRPVTRCGYIWASPRENLSSGVPKKWDSNQPA